MTPTPHVFFRARSPRDEEFDDPPGAVIARMLDKKLEEEGITHEPFDNWRDCGWWIICTINGKQVQIYFASWPQTAEDGWLLAIAPLREVGFFGRIFGKKPIDYSSEINQLSQLVDRFLNENEMFSNIRWCLNGVPNELGVTGLPC